MVRTVLCLSLLGLGSAGCASPGRSPAAQFAAAPAELPDSNVARAFHLGRSHGSSRTEITARLGDPANVRVELVPNRHGAGTDSLIRLDYGSRAYWLRRPAGSARELLELVELTARGQPIAGGIVVQRTTFDQLRDRLGQPQQGERRGDTLMVTYRAPGAGPEELIRFDLVRDVVRRVIWIFYVD